MIAAQILIVASASITALLGAVHLAYTFRGRLLTPRDPALQAGMGNISPVISKETTMWRCWIGFNASHSMGLLLFGIIYGYLALIHSQILFGSTFLLAVGLVTLCGYAVLSKAYFFRVPFAGVLIASACYIAGIALSRL